MIYEYTCGQELLDGNKELLGANKYQAVFFYWDAPLLKETDKINYAMKCTQGDRELLVLKVEPFNLMLLGAVECAAEVIGYIMKNGYDIRNYLCGCDVGNEIARIMEAEYGISYVEALPMDFMEAYECTQPSDSAVVPAEPEEIDQVVECMERFVKDCRLETKVDRDRTLASIGEYRVLRIDGRIASIAKAVPESDGATKVTDVYTREEYRGRGYARRVVGTTTNEILAAGKIATLNVDRSNPITNHLYRTLGYKPIFSQGEYRRK